MTPEIINIVIKLLLAVLKIFGKRAELHIRTSTQVLKIYARTYRRSVCKKWFYNANMLLTIINNNYYFTTQGVPGLFD